MHDHTIALVVFSLTGWIVIRFGDLIYIHAYAWGYKTLNFENKSSLPDSVLISLHAGYMYASKMLSRSII